MAFDEFDLLHPEELGEDRNRTLAKLLSVFASLLLFVEFWRGQALGQADHWGREALRRATEGIRAQAAADAEWRFSSDVLSEAGEASARHLTALEAARSAPVASAERDLHLAEAERWDAVIKFLEGLDSRGTPGPRFDPLSLLARTRIPVEISSLRQEAASEREQFWQKKATYYAVATTGLGISIVLLSLAFVMKARFRLLLVMAVTFSGVSLAIFLWALLVQEPTTPEKAIRHVAEGNAWLLRRRPNEAIVEYRQALVLRQDYGRASMRKAAAHFALGTRPFRAFIDADSAEPIARGRHLDRYVEDLERASNSGLNDDPQVIEQLAYGFLLQGRYQEASSKISEATEEQPESAQFWLDRVAISTAIGNDKDARFAAAQAVTLFADPQRLSTQGLLNEQYARTRTALAQLDPKKVRNSQVRSIHARLLLDQMRLLSQQRVAKSGLPGATAYEFTFAFAPLVPNAVHARFKLHGVPSNEPLALVWSFRADRQKPWREIAEAFELRPAGAESDAQEARVPLLGCPARGEYRLAVVLRGRVVGEGQASTPPGFPPSLLCD